jgi:hypothetical protein
MHEEQEVRPAAEKQIWSAAASTGVPSAASVLGWS